MLLLLLLDHHCPADATVLCPLQVLREGSTRAAYDRHLAQQLLRASVAIQEEVALSDMEQAQGEEGEGPLRACCV
jgi:hypothetical protein